MAPRSRPGVLDETESLVGAAALRLVFTLIRSLLTRANSGGSLGFRQPTTMTQCGQPAPLTTAKQASPSSETTRLPEFRWVLAQAAMALRVNTGNGAS